MSDLRLRWAIPTAGDLVISANDLTVDDGLETAVVLSLFTDRRANSGDVLPSGPDDRRGWWADALPVVAGDQIGSRLWLLSREKQEPSVLSRAKTYVLEALQWLITDGVAAAITVTTEFTAVGLLGIRVLIDRPHQDTVSFAFGYAWDAQAKEAV